MTIRRFARRAAGLDDFDAGGRATEFLTDAVRCGWNLMVSGATSAGKTTLLGALGSLVPTTERIVTIEETLELTLARPNLVRLEARPPNAEGAGVVTIRELVRAALRMRPDRIVVGEVRGGEALDMLQAMSTGHDGSLSTIHANGAIDALDRLETLVLMAGVGLAHEAVRRQVAQAVDAVVHTQRDVDGRRRILEIVEVGIGDDRCRPLFTRDADGLAPRRAPRRAARRPTTHRRSGERAGYTS